MGRLAGRALLGQMVDLAAVGLSVALSGRGLTGVAGSVLAVGGCPSCGSVRPSAGWRTGCVADSPGAGVICELRRMRPSPSPPPTVSACS